MKIAPTAPWLFLALFTSAASAYITVPINTLRNPIHLNADSLTRRYLHRRDSPPTDNVNSTATTNFTESFGNVQLTNVESDVMYTIPFGLGTPAQTFNVVIDTGSPITWLSSSSCEDEACLTATRFHCDTSTSCKTLNNNFSASYVSGQGVSGHYVAETYTIGSLQFRGATGIVTQNKAQLPARVDGIMGLWYFAPGSSVPILNVLSNSTILPLNMIGIWLQSTTPHGQVNDTPAGDYTAGGEITFGGVDTTKFSGHISFVDCVGKRPWSIPVGGMTVGGTKINVNGAVAAIDTGTTAMLVPRAAADSINGAIPGSIRAATQGGLWYMPCSGDTEITMTFGAITVKIPYTHLALQSARSKTQQGDYCLSAVMFPTGQTAVIQEWLIGDVFLKNVYSVFDFGTNAATGGRIGFAQLGSGGLNSGDRGRKTSVLFVRFAIMGVLGVIYLVL